jgi:hypothetical protein
MTDDERRGGERVEKESGEAEETPSTGEAAREATSPAAEGEPGVPPPGSQEMGSTADVARSVHEGTAERRETAPSVDDRTATGFTDEAEERVTEPDQALADVESSTDIAGVPGSVVTTHEAEGLTTLEEAVEAPDAQGGDRFSDLMSKRKRVGLTDKEAEELGRLVAEREGQSHWSARSSREEQGAEAES